MIDISYTPVWIKTKGRQVSSLWGLDSKGVESLCIAWRKARRMLWR